MDNIEALRPVLQGKLNLAPSELQLSMGILALFGNNATLSDSGAARAIGMRQPTVSRVAKQLENVGLLHRSRSPVVYGHIWDFTPLLEKAKQF